MVFNYSSRIKNDTYFCYINCLITQHSKKNVLLTLKMCFIEDLKITIKVFWGLLGSIFLPVYVLIVICFHFIYILFCCCLWNDYEILKDYVYNCVCCCCFFSEKGRKKFVKTLIDSSYLIRFFITQVLLTALDIFTDVYQVYIYFLRYLFFAIIFCHVLFHHISCLMIVFLLAIIQYGLHKHCCLFGYQ